MPRSLTSTSFPDEDRWPFIGRNDDLERCLSFLAPHQSDVPSRLLRIVGESGTGKSFFCKELICRFTERAPSTVGLYVNVEESQFESSELEKRLALIASYPATPSRSDPQHIPINADLATYLRPLPRWVRALRYGYKGVREATAELPGFGSVVKGLLPEQLPVSKQRELANAGRFWDYLMVTARRDPVLLVLDNFQFLPNSVAVELDALLAIADIGFRLVIVDRLREGVSEAWKLRCFSDHRLSTNLMPLSESDTERLVRSILGEQTPNLTEVCDLIFRKSGGNPKQIWLQLRTFELSRESGSESVVRGAITGLSQGSQTALGTYEETIDSLPLLDRMTLQLVTLLMGGLKVDDIVGILRRIINKFSEEEIRHAILDLALVGLVIVNGTQNNRVRTEHELVTRSVRRMTSESEAIELRHQVVSALSQRLDGALEDAEYERLVDRLVGLLSPEDLRQRHDLLAHLISLIDRQNFKERFHYLTGLFGTTCCEGVLDILPPHSLGSFLDAFQKTSQFDKGLAAVELMRKVGKISPRVLSIFGAKYLVQKFEYGDAEALLRQLPADSDRDVVLFNILLNLRRDDEARQIVSKVHTQKADLDEFQCVMLRNAGHLYDPRLARELMIKAKEGFKKLGSKFGEATALNNIGVLELWASKNDEARRLLVQSRAILEGLDSNELYQPLTNLAILHAIEGDLIGAKQLFDEADMTVSPWLRMDATMLRFNRLILDLMNSNVGGAEAAVRARDLFRHSLQTKDLRFQVVLAWFLHQIEVAFGGQSSVPEQAGFETSIRKSKCAGLEIFSEINVEGRQIDAVFVLSPHWRY